jgi:Zn-dependent protease
MGLAMMFVLGFGWAKPVPVNPGYFKNPKRGMAFTALAGPVSNFLLAFSLCLIGSFVYFHAPYTVFWDGLYGFLMSSALLSIGLGLFNLIPIPPLDGSKVLFALLPDRWYGSVLRYEKYGFLILLILSFTDVGFGFIGGGIDWIFSAMISLVFGL